MSGEYINAKTVEEYWNQLKSIYVKRSTEWKDLTEAEYKEIERSEREDSDNHFNEGRLGKETDVIDICHYKYVPERYVAYKIALIHKDGSKQEFYFQIKLKEEID
jgi:hypothetical protein